MTDSSAIRTGMVEQPIVWVVDSPGWGGSEVDLIRVMKFIGKSGVLLHSPRAAEQLLNSAQDLNMRCIPVPSGSKAAFAPKALSYAIRNIAKFRHSPFAVWTHHSDSARWFSLALAVLRRRYAVCERLMPDRREAFDSSRLTLPIKRWTSGFATNVVLNAHSQVEPFRKIFGIAGRNLSVIANTRPVGQIAERVANLRNDPGTLREKLGLPPGPLVACVGRLAGQKDQSTLVSAMASVTAKASLVLVGEGPDRAVLESLRRNLAGQRVVFAGHQSDPLPWLSAADLFVLPSLTEGLPGALIEAMAAGLPCIATDIPGNRELVMDGVTGLSVPTKSPELLAKAINRLLDNPALAQRLAAAGFEHVAAHYDEAAEKAAWQRLAAELVG